MYKSVTIKEDDKLEIIRISSKPNLFAIVLFVACLIGFCSLPYTSYRKDYFAYIGLLFVLGLAVYYFVISIQRVSFESNTKVRVRKGFASWDIPLEKVTGGYTSYQEKTSRQSLQRTYFLNFELEVSLPDNKHNWIRNGKANIFHYGFNDWGAEQEKIWVRMNDILKEKGIPNHTRK